MTSIDHCSIFLFWLGYISWIFCFFGDGFDDFFILIKKNRKIYKKKENKMEKISIQGVSETMLQTLYARANESKKENHMIYDAKAIEIVSQIDYDFSIADKDLMMSKGVIARTIVLDQMIQDFISIHSQATIINIACGLDTRFYRVDNGKVRWYNLDLPDVIAIRKRFLAENDRVSMISASAIDKKWVRDIKETSDVLIIIEGLTMYLSEKDISTILHIIDQHFLHVTIFMETMAPFAVKHIKEKSVEASQAKFSWGIKNGKELEKIAPAFHFIEDVSLVSGMKEMMSIYKLLEKMPFVKNISNKITILKK